MLNDEATGTQAAAPTKPITRAAAYAWIIPNAMRVARQHGYAIAVHGSMHRDLDLMAMPWTDEAVSPTELVEAIREAVEGRIVPDGTKGGRWDADANAFVSAVVRQPEHKPHGRLAWNIHFADNAFVIDISVMPRSPAIDPREALKPVAREIRDRVGSDVGDSSWNPDAHVELTLTAAECWLILEASKAAREGISEEVSDSQEQP